MEPVLVALLFADRVLEEKNGKKSVIGIFDRFAATQFPKQFPPWFIFASVTNVLGRHTFALNLVKDDGSDHAVVSFSGEIDVKARSGPVELIFQVAGATFPSEGDYSLAFDLAGARVGNRMLHVHRLQKGASASPGDGPSAR